jgi:protein-tyrosine phosphatase
MIDLHTHILPDLDDGPRTWEDALAMARLAAADGIKTVVATPHLFRRRTVDLAALNPAEAILETTARFQTRLNEAGLDLTVVPGCEVPLCYEAIGLLEEGRLLSLGNGNRYLCLEMPDLAIPATVQDLVFQFSAKGLTPIITHPERNLVFMEMPDKLLRLLQLGCLAQVTAGSLTGAFGRRVAKFAKSLVTKGYAHVVASDAHNCQGRPPQLAAAVQVLTKLVGKDRAWEMVSGTPQKILNGEWVS